MDIKAKKSDNIIDLIPAMIFYKDTENRFVRVNQSFADAMGMSKEELEGKSCFDVFPKEQAEKYWQDDKEIFAAKQAKRNIIESMETKHQGTRWVQTDKIICYDDQNNIIGIIGFTLDITDKKVSEDILKERNEELEKMNKIMIGREKRMAELKKEIKELKEKVNEI